MRGAAAGAAVFLLFLPVFFAFYRLMAFDTVPRDDYAPFLLWLTGAPGGAFPSSPYGYRILSVAFAVPFTGLPGLPLTNLPASLTGAYLHATAALAMLSYVSVLLAAAIIFRLARRAGLPARDGLLAAILLAGLCGFTEFLAVDPLALCWIALCLYAMPSRAWFAALILVSPFINEKIVIVLCVALTGRCLFDPAARRTLWLQWVATLAAAAVYVLMLRFVALPGNGYQLEPHAYLTTLAGNLRTSMSPRGVVLNVLPVVIMCAVGLAAWRERGRVGFSGSDLLTLPALALVAFTLTETLQVGRLVAMAAPLLVVPAAAWIGRRLDEEAGGRHNPAAKF